MGGGGDFIPRCSGTNKPASAYRVYLSVAGKRRKKAGLCASAVLTEDDLRAKLHGGYLTMASISYTPAKNIPLMVLLGSSVTITCPSAAAGKGTGVKRE